jgi:hypothetical protein
MESNASSPALPHINSLNTKTRQHESIAKLNRSFMSDLNKSPKF